MAANDYWFQRNAIQGDFIQGGASCFDPKYFDPAAFDTSCAPSSGGGSHRRRANISMPIIDPAMHDDDLALLLLEAA